MDRIKNLGQVFTPKKTVDFMISLRKNTGTVLEPSVGEGSFFNSIVCTGIELDKSLCPAGCHNIDFFDFPTTNKFNTIIGNPPYVGFKNIIEDTKNKLKEFDQRTNLYVYFINKCLDHLLPNGEIIFITPREFFKATSAIKLNEKIWKLGTITDLFDLGDSRIFDGYNPNCVIWRFEKDNYQKKTRLNGEDRNFKYVNGQLLFLKDDYTLAFSDLFYVKVGAVSGMDDIFTHPDGNLDFVCSNTRSDGKLRKMLYNVQHDHLLEHKERLISRKIKKFNENNWWQWGRGYYFSDEERIYVNCKTRVRNPFFLNTCKNYDGSILAIFFKKAMNINKTVTALNNVAWDELGFVCDGRYIFSQRSLQNTLLPQYFLDSCLYTNI